MTNWFEVVNISEIDTPAIFIYPDRIKRNIQAAISRVGDVRRLRPHVKTNKSANTMKLMLDAGIKKFKCATISEAEVLGELKAPDVILAYQPNEAKALRLAALMRTFPETSFSALVDNISTAKMLSNLFSAANTTLRLYIDLNVGMNRTGIAPEEARSLVNGIHTLPGIEIVGLHAYDGHLRDTDFALRQQKCDEAFARVLTLRNELIQDTGKSLNIVAGGTPTFSIHAHRDDVECSPGTFIYWDTGYGGILKEQQYDYAAIVATRVVSKPAADLITVDLGHKAIASENPLTSRVTFLNAPDVMPVGQSEEHLVLRTTRANEFQIGDVLYGVPYHVCPTVALYDFSHVIEGNRKVTEWLHVSRNRRIKY